MLHSYFLALQPDADAVRRIMGLMRDRATPEARLMPPARLHVSLHALGISRAPMDRQMERALAAAARVRRPPFRLEFNRVAAFGRSARKALVLRGDEGTLGADLLRGDIHAALACAGLAPARERSFEPHLTLMRGPLDAPEAFIAPISWTVRAFVLIHSRLGEPRYEIVERFPLSADPVTASQRRASGLAADRSHAR